MKKVITSIGIAALCLASQAVAQNNELRVHCDFEEPRGTVLTSDGFVSTEMGFPGMEGTWEYDFIFTPSEVGAPPADIEIRSEGDPATISGSYKVLTIAPETYAVLAVRGGGCMFSSQLCGAFVQLTNLDSDEAAAAITPMSYSGNQSSDVTFLYISMFGRCNQLDSEEGGDQQ